MIEKFLKKIAHFQTSHPFYTLLILIVLTILIWGGISQVKTVASLELMMPKDIEEIRAFNTLRDNGLGQDYVAIVLQTGKQTSIENQIYDITDKKLYNYLESLKTELQKETDVLNTYSIANFEYDEINNSEMQSQIQEYVNNDKTATLFLIRTDIATNDERMSLFATKIKTIANELSIPEGVEVSFTGTPIIQQRLGELINQDRSNTQWISTLLVFTITAIIFRSFLSAIVPIIVVFGSVNWLYGTMGYTNLPISTLAGGVAAMVIGIGIDFAIHIMNKFKYERKQKKSIAESIELAVSETGMALAATSLTTMAAFLAFLVGVMPEMGRFGMLMAIGIFYSLLFSLIGLPALLIIEEKIIYYSKKHLKFGIDKEFHLEGGKE